RTRLHLPSHTKRHRRHLHPPRCRWSPRLDAVASADARPAVTSATPTSNSGPARDGCRLGALATRSVESGGPGASGRRSKGVDMAAATAQPIISADSHITEPPDCYTKYIDPKYREDAPH